MVDVVNTASVDGPTDIGFSSREVTNNSPTGTFVCKLTALNGTPGYVYSIADDPYSKFSISGFVTISGRDPLPSLFCTLFLFFRFSLFQTTFRSEVLGPPALAIENTHTQKKTPTCVGTLNSSLQT